MSITLALFLGILLYILIAFGPALYKLAVFTIRAKILLKDLAGPPSLPIIGSAHLFKLNSLDFTYQLEDWARTYTIGGRESGLIVAWIGPVPIAFLIAPESARIILESNLNITKATQYDIISQWIGTGLLTSTGSKWFARRKMITPTFHFNILQGYQDVFAAQGQILADQLEKEVGHYFDIFPYIKRCALDVICETAMGTDMKTQTGGNTDYVDAVTRISAIIWEQFRFPWLWLKPVWYGTGIGFEFDRLVQLTNDFTRKVISERKKLMEETMFDEEGPNQKRKMAFLDMLLTMQKEKDLSDEDIREEVDTFMFEGHDTTSSGMGFTLWWLGQTPRCQKLVQEELDEIFGDDDRLPTGEDVKKMVYLEKCVKESLRLFPSVPLLARRLESDLHMNDITLPEGLTVVVAPLAAQRDPRAYEFPEDFYPEHFDADKTAKRDPYSYIPFSAGPRNCIGQKFAVLEEKTVLACVLRKYNIETKEPWPGNRPVPEVILKPVVGFQVKLTPRVK